MQSSRGVHRSLAVSSFHTEKWRVEADERSFSSPPPTRKRSTISALHPRCRVVCEVSALISKGFGSCLRPLERLSSWSKSPIPPFFSSVHFSGRLAPREPMSRRPGGRAHKNDSCCLVCVAKMKDLCHSGSTLGLNYTCVAPFEAALVPPI